MVNIPDKQFNQLIKSMREQTAAITRLSDQIDQLLHINTEILDMVAASYVDDQEELTAPSFLDGTMLDS